VSWKDRVRPEIKLTSPSGKIFKAFWIANSRTKEKKLGIFEYPKVDGTIVQDLGTNGTRYPLNFVFVGSDHDLVAERFYKTCNEKGSWSIIHPVKGQLVLQLADVEEAINPVESGNITEFSTNWIEAIEPGIVESVQQLIGSIKSFVDVLNDISGNQLEQNIDETTSSNNASLKNAVNTVVTAYDNTILPAFSGIGDIAAKINRIKQNISGVLESTPLDISIIGALLQNLILIPAPIFEVSYSQRNNSYTDFKNLIISALPTGNDSEAKNVTSIFEVSLVAVLAAFGLIATTSIDNNIGIQASGLFVRTKDQAFDAAGLLSDNFISVVDALDSSQALYEDKPVEKQYFSQSESFSDSYSLIMSAIAYLIKSGFDLSVEKRFILQQPRAPIEITITEYGSLGEDDYNYDLFIDSNSLKGKDILLLEAGREVVIYV